jgi:hypothetical protein
MCIRQDESPAEHTPAPVEEMLLILSASIAEEVAAFLSANPTSTMGRSPRPARSRAGH